MFFFSNSENFQGFRAPMGTLINMQIPPISEQTEQASHRTWTTKNNNLSLGFKWKPQVCFLSNLKRSYQS